MNFKHFFLSCLVFSFSLFLGVWCVCECECECGGGAGAGGGAGRHIFQPKRNIELFPSPSLPFLLLPPSLPVYIGLMASWDNGKIYTFVSAGFNHGDRAWLFKAW